MSSKICLSLNEKMKVIEESEKESFILISKLKSLMNTFKCGKTQIYNIIKIKEEWLKGNGKSKRSLKKTVNDDIKKAVWDWFVFIFFTYVIKVINNRYAKEIDKTINVPT